MVFRDVRRKTGRSLDSQSSTQPPHGSWRSHWVSGGLRHTVLVASPTQTSSRGCSGYGHRFLGLSVTHKHSCGVTCTTQRWDRVPPRPPLQLCRRSTLLLVVTYAGGTLPGRRGNPPPGRAAGPDLHGRGSDTYLFRLRLDDPHGQTSR